MTSDFDRFLAGRDAVGQAYITGDAEPLTAMSAQEDPATFFPPNGGYVQGAADVLATNQRGAQMFAPGGETHFEILHSSADGDLGYQVAIQRATVQLTNRDEPVPMDLRITEIYRRDGGEWKLIHRHADSNTSSG